MGAHRAIHGGHHAGVGAMEVQAPVQDALGKCNMHCRVHGEHNTSHSLINCITTNFYHDLGTVNFSI
jgi:hypothetical protein